MIKTVYTSEYLINSGYAPSYALLPAEMLLTEKKMINIVGDIEQPSVECNVIKLGKEITKDIESSGAISKILFVPDTLEQNPPFTGMNFGLYYELKINGVYQPQFVNTWTGITTDNAIYEKEVALGNGICQGIDLLGGDRYSIPLAEDIRNVELVMWYGLGTPIEGALEITTLPTFISFYVQITQQA